jgi:hypothetical protein
MQFTALMQPFELLILEENLQVVFLRSYNPKNDKKARNLFGFSKKIICNKML